MMDRRKFLLGLLGGVAAVGLPTAAEAAPREGFWFFRRRKPAKPAPVRPATARKAKAKPASKTAQKRKAGHKPAYAGRRVVDFASSEKPGTIIIRTQERALYQILGNGKAMRYLVAVGKEGFSWSGTARVGMKRVNPVWTPPPEMIARTPKYAKWAGGMPGGIPENPLGVRALYLFNKKGDTGFRIHGTNAPGSIGTAASSGCIRMLNREVTELYDATPKGTKVIVI